MLSSDTACTGNNIIEQADGVSFYGGPADGGCGFIQCWQRIQLLRGMLAVRRQERWAVLNLSFSTRGCVTEVQLQEWLAR
jgi:hypothetical protein